MNVRRYILSLLIMTGLVIIQTGSYPVYAKSRPHLSASDSIRIVEAFRLNHRLAQQVWPGWQQTSIPLILVTNSYEFLVGSSSPDQGFQPLCSDSLLGQPVFIRSRVFPKNTFATTYYINNQPTVIAGQPEKTYTQNSTRWVLAVNHEFFHAYQFSRPEYDHTLRAMALANGDPTGSWMIEYSFPYRKSAINTSFSEYTRLLHKALETKNKTSSEKNILFEVSQKRHDLFSQLSYNDSQYFRLQVWQEGIARYVEYKLALIASKDYQTTSGFDSLSDVIPFNEAANEILNNMMLVLPRMTLSEQKRLTFYYVGFAEGLLLDRVSSDWKRDYFDSIFNLGDLLFPTPSLANLK